MRILATAKVQVTLEVEAGSWGHDCSIGQLHDQAAESGLREVLQLLKEGAGSKCRIVGKPRVIGIVTSNEP